MEDKTPPPPIQILVGNFQSLKIKEIYAFDYKKKLKSHRAGEHGIGMQLTLARREEAIGGIVL